MAAPPDRDPAVLRLAENVGRGTVRSLQAIGFGATLVWDSLGWLLGSGLNLPSFLHAFLLGLFIIAAIGGLLGWFGWMKDRKGPGEQPA